MGASGRARGSSRGDRQLWGLAVAGRRRCPRAWGSEGQTPPLRYEGGKGRSVQGCGIQTGGRRAFLDEVSQDLEGLHGVGDHSDDLHGLVASRAAQGVRFIDLLDQSSPASRRFLRNGCRPRGGAALFGGYGHLGLRLLGRADAEGWLGWMIALPALGSRTGHVGLAGPPSRRASAPAGPGVPRAREEYRCPRHPGSNRCARVLTSRSLHAAR
jgi:hypothetical protein